MQRRTLVTAVAATSLIVVPATAGSAFGLTSGTSGTTTALTNSVPSSLLTHSGVGPTVTGPASSSQRIDFALQLPLRNWARAQALTARGKAVGDAAYQREFAPTRAAVDRVVAWARHNGYSIESVNRGAGAVNVSATIARVNSTLGAAMAAATFKGVHGVTATRAPLVPTSLGLAGITGLNTTIVVKPTHVTGPKATRSSVGNPEACAYYWGQNTNPLAQAKFTYASNNICGYKPKDLPAMYHVTGAGNFYAPKLGILLPFNSSSALSNVNHLMTANKYPQLAAGNYHVTTPSSYDTSQCGDIYGWYSEQTLDLTTSHSIAPKAPIYYTAAKSCLFTDTLVAFQGAVSRHASTTISMSFGSSTDRASALGQSVIDGWTKTAAQASLKGISVFASTGDNGDNSESTGAVGVGFPASDPYITAVGGTSEGINPDGSSVVRTGWEDEEMQGSASKFYAGANGGPSQTFKMPTWQMGKVPGPNPYRRLPDVSALADPFTGILLYTAHSGYQTYGGTSLASPATAAITGLAKSYNKRTFGLASPSLYKMIGTSAVNDITPHRAGVYVAGTGDILMAFDTGPQSLQSKTGWDNVTGVGVPNGTPFLAAVGK